MKTCTRCQETKDLGNFRPRKKGGAALHTWCVACFSATAKERNKALDPNRRFTTKTKLCNSCHKTKTTEEFAPSHATNDGWVGSCRPCQKLKTKDTALKETYGITLTEYDAMAENQDHVCAICGSPSKDTGKALAVDHDHRTGAVRELLCGPCNRGLGLFEDRADLLTAAAAYLNKHKE